MKFVLTEEGYIEKATGSATYTAHYYLNDRLGNRRIVMDAAGTVRQVNNYYPSGTSMAERRTDQAVQPYKFGGKELDRTNNLDFYDFVARSYDPVLMRFTRPDPLAEKYPWIGTYVYCANNPIRYTDPTGKDVWEINDQGAIVNRKKDKTQDAFYKVDSEGKRLEGDRTSKTFAYGTIKSQKVVSIDVKQADGSVSKENITIFEVKGDDKASEIFNFMINPKTNNVEWGLVQIGSTNSGQNLLGTMQQESSSGIGSYALGYGYTIRQSDHNHPGEDRAVPSENDVNNAKAISDKFPNAKFNIYVLPNQPTPFNKNSPYMKATYPGSSYGRLHPGKTW